VTKPRSSRRGVSRRTLLRNSAAAVAGGATLVASGGALSAAAGGGARQAAAPAIQQGRNTGRRFRTFLRFGTGTVVEDVRLLAMQPRQVPGISLALLGRTIHPGQQGGLHAVRDIPRFVKLIEKGKIDAKSMITRTYRIEDTRQAVQTRPTARS